MNAFIPSNVYPRVLEAMARPTIGQLDPKFINLMDKINALYAPHESLLILKEEEIEYFWKRYKSKGEKLIL